MSNIDLRQAQEDERNRRLASAKQIQRPDPRTGATGTGFGNYERQQAENDARVREHKANEFNDWFQRANGRPATEDEIAQYLGEQDSDGAA